MAELLVSWTPRPSRTASGQYARGDIVAIRGDGVEWGRKERLPLYIVIRLPNVPMRRLEEFVEEEIGQDPFLVQPTRVRRRRWYIDVDALSAADRETLGTTGRLSTTWQALRGAVVNKRTRERAPELTSE